MYKQNKTQPTSLEVNQSYPGERIEDKISRIINNKEPIKDGAPIIYTERRDGVQPQFNIRTDRFEIAVEAMDKVSASHKAAREQRHNKLGEEAKKGQEKEGDGKPTGEPKE